MNLKILYVGQSWLGSSARSLKEALMRQSAISLEAIDEDFWRVRGYSRPARIANRLILRWSQAELAQEIRNRIRVIKPDVLVVYKGSLVSAHTVRQAQEAGVFTVNVFPDCSPHAHGHQLRDAMAEYNLVISTKPFHPSGWQSVYGYQNSCIYVPHGYDPNVHYWSEPSVVQDIDLIMVASWRSQYQGVLAELATTLESDNMNVVVAGPGWQRARRALPPHWKFIDGCYGRAYGELVRRGKIIVAPVHREMVVSGKQQPGDEDSTRSYELAAAGCFFLHRRTPHIQSVYSEDNEVPMWSDANELAELIRHFLPLDDTRRRMAARAHSRAVPAYSIDARARQVAQILRQHLCLDK